MLYLVRVSQKNVQSVLGSIRNACTYQFKKLNKCKTGLPDMAVLKHVFFYTPKHAQARTHTRTNICVHTVMNKQTCMHASAHTIALSNVRTCAFARAHTHTHTHAGMHACTYSCTRTNIPACVMHISNISIYLYIHIQKRPCAVQTQA